MDSNLAVSYVVASALRGPDIATGWVREPFRALKIHLTGRLRYIAGMNPDTSVVVTDDQMTDGTFSYVRWALQSLRDTLASLAQENRSFTDVVADGAHHYLLHTLWAIDKTQTHPVWGGYAEDVMHVLSECINFLCSDEFTVAAKPTSGGTT